MPNGSLLKQNLPNRVINVVSKADSFWSVICQNPEFASSLENTLASPNWTRMCSTEGIGCRSLWTLSFNLVRSTQIRILPSDFGPCAPFSWYINSRYDPSFLHSLQFGFHLRKKWEGYSSWCCDSKWSGIITKADCVLSW